MGACLSSLGLEQGQAIREAFGGAKPEALHQDLRPFLALELDGLLEAYRRAASLRLETVLPTQIATLLGLPPQAARRLCRCKAVAPPPAPRPKSARTTSKASPGQSSPLSSARRSSRPTSAAGNARTLQVLPPGILEVLTTMAILSHTHESVKIRFLFSLFDRDGEGLLDPVAAAGAARALSWAAGCLSQPSIDTPSNPALFDMAVRALFAKGVDKIHSGVLVNALLGWDLTCHFLRRFARGGSAVPFQMEPWNSFPLPFLLYGSEVDGDGQHGVTKYKDYPSVLPPMPARRPASAGAGKGRPAVLGPARPGSAARPSPSARSAMSARSAATVMSMSEAASALPSNQPFTPKQGGQGGQRGLVPGELAAASTPMSGMSMMSPDGSGLGASRFGNLAGRSPMGQSSPVKAMPAQAPAGAAGVADVDDAPLPTRNGYFQCVASPEAQELLGELDDVRTSKHKALNEHNRGQAIELQSKEDALVSEIWKEAADQGKRKEYRKLLEEFRRQVPGGRWWTASKDHMLRGGVLPCNVKRPLLPADVQQRLLASGRLRAPSSKTKKQRQSKELDQSRTDRRLAISIGKAAGDPNLDATVGSVPALDAESPQGSSDESSEGERSHASKVREAGRIRVKRRDALLAFEMYRWSYWRHRQAPNPNQRHLDKSMIRRNQDIDAIFAEQLASDAKPSSWFVGCSTLDLTLKMFLRKLWPRCSKEEMSAMMHWIWHSKENLSVQTRTEREAADASPMCLRELVDLFDAVDKDKIGRVSLDGIERFLCGEITTSREAADLKQYKIDLGDGRSVTEFERYRDVNREMHSLRFVNSSIPDRKEWQLLRESKDRRVPPPTPAASGASTAGPSEAAAQAQAMAKTLGRHMEKLGKFLDEACSKRDKADTESVLSKNMEVATRPTATPKLSEQQLSLVRLYYRHLLGSALHALLRSEGDQPSVAHVRIQQNGKLDLLSFINLMAADQVASFLPPGKVPSECLIRRIAHGVQ